MFIVYLTNDLMFSSRVSGAAQTSGAELRVVGSAAELLDALASHQDTRLVLLDLSFPGLNLADLLPKIRSAATAATVIAYGPHVHEQKLAEAANAGCDQVFSKGQFSSTIAELIRG